MSEIIGFITYTKGAVQYVTSPLWETPFLDWLNSVDSSAGYTRETFKNVGIKCCPVKVHDVVKKEATILSLVKSEAAE